MQKGAPVFVKIEEYKEVLDILDSLKEKIADANELFAKINTLHSKEESELESWQTNIKTVGQKISLIDKNLFEVNN